MIEIEIHGKLYGCAAWVHHPGQEIYVWHRRWTEVFEGPNWNPVAFGGSPVPIVRAGVDVLPFIAAAIGQSLRRAWALSPGENVEKILLDHLGPGYALVVGNLSPRANVRDFGRAFCEAEAALIGPGGTKISIHLLVARDHDENEIGQVARGTCQLCCRALE